MKDSSFDDRWVSQSSSGMNPKKRVSPLTSYRKKRWAGRIGYGRVSPSASDIPGEISKNVRVPRFSVYPVPVIAPSSSIDQVYLNPNSPALSTTSIDSSSKPHLPNIVESAKTFSSVYIGNNAYGGVSHALSPTASRIGRIYAFDIEHLSRFLFNQSSV